MPIIENMFVCPNAANPKKQARPKYFLYFRSIRNFPVPYGKFDIKILYHTDVWIVNLWHFQTVYWSRSSSFDFSLWLSSHYSDVREMADYTIVSSVNIKTGNKVRNIVSNGLYLFNNKLTWKRFSMKSYIQRNWHWKKWTMWPILSDKTAYSTGPRFTKGRKL